MSEVIISFRIMPESTDTDMEKLRERAETIISKAGEIGKVEIQPVAFGLKAIIIHEVMDESKGSPDNVEEELNQLEEVNRAEIIDVRRTVDI